MSEPQPPNAPAKDFVANDLLRRAAMKMEVAYLGPGLRDDPSLELTHEGNYRRLAKEFHLEGLDSHKYGPKFEDMATGFRKIALLDDAYWRMFRQQIPSKVPLDEGAKSFVTDLALMQVRFDAYSMGTTKLDKAVKKQVGQLLTTLGFPADAQENSDNGEGVKDVTLQDIIKLILNGSIDVEPLIEP